jgi:hypothetical protein
MNGREVLPSPLPKVTHWKIDVYQPNVLPVLRYEHCINLTHNSNRRGMSFITEMGTTIHTSLPFLAEEEE